MQHNNNFILIIVFIIVKSQNRDLLAQPYDYVITNKQDHEPEKVQWLSMLLEDTEAQRMLSTFQALNVQRVLQLKDFLATYPTGST